MARRRMGVYALLMLVWTTGAVHAAPAPSALLHKRAPDFTRKDLAGGTVSMRAERGKVVLLNFWATWCGPCKVELPRFAAWQKEYGPQGLVVIAVSMDDSDRAVRVWERRLKPDFPVVMGDAKIGELYGGVLGLPVTFLIGRDGRVETQIEGGADLPALEKQIRRLLAEGQR